MADVSSILPNWSTTRASNSPSGSTIVGAGVDDNLREIQGTVRGWLASKGANISVAGTVDLGAVEGSTHDLIGSGTITSFGTISAGIRKRLRMNAAVTITHNATTLICPGAANLSLVANDIVDVESTGGGNWFVANVERYNGKAPVTLLASDITSTAAGRMTATVADTALTQLQTLSSAGFRHLTVSGTNTLSATGDALITSYVTGDRFSFVPVATNTGTVTLNISALGSKNITKHGTTVLTAGDIVNGTLAYVVYDGTQFQLLNPQIPAFGGLSSSGATALASTLAVTGAATLSSTLQVAGSTTMEGASATSLAVTNNATVGGTLGVTGLLTAAATESKAASGYIKLYEGLYVQWGTATIASSALQTDTQSVSYPTAFPTAVLRVLICGQAVTTPALATFSASSLGTSNFTLGWSVPTAGNLSGGTVVTYIAIGY